MKNIRRILAALAAVSIVLLCACGGGDGESTTAANETEKTTSAASAEIEVTTPFSLPNYKLPAEKVDLSKGVTDTMMERAVLNEGNLTRLAGVMKKAESGEKITVGFIGGSITQGSSSSGPQNCYAYKTYSWWADKFPNTEVEYVNAGIGATDSYLGVHRVEKDLLSKNPDVVVVEFSVNDTNKLINPESYESLVRKILGYENSPALVLLCTTMEDGTSFQLDHAEVGVYYDLPIISYHDVVYPEVAAGNIVWKDISPDNIHPNDVGHDMIGQMMGKFFDSVYEKKDSVGGDYNPLEKEPLSKDRYAKGTLYDNTNLTPTEMESYTLGTTFDRYKNGWKTADGSGSLVFDIEARNVGIIFYKVTSGAYGKYDVFVDGEHRATLDADFKGGWGNYSEVKEVFRATDGSTAVRHIEIKPAEGSEGGFEVLGVLVS